MGLSDDGVEETLYAVHESTLTSTSFHAEWSKYDLDNGVFKWRKQYDSDVGQAVGRGSVRTNYGPSDVYLVEGVGSLWREELVDGYSYGANPEGWETGKPMWQNEIQPLFEAGDWSAPERLNHDRPAVWEVSTNSVADPSAVIGYYDGETVALSGTLRVDERGFFREVEATASVREDEARGGAVHEFETEFAVDSVGEVTVSEPSWVATVRERRPKVTASLADGDRYVELSLTGGNRIEPNSWVAVWDESVGGSYNLTLDEPIESGETVYLYRAEPDASTSLRISRGGKPSTPPTREFTNPVDVWARRTTLLYFKESL
ncbi:hypothetical protein G9C85_16720 [Halorubellus sp. JP-L1]|uniref:hypothetical protein n=1 Tax=Halorubellus sp. JP-L1 TaxID=2715753 RepID=UPI00140C7635|nr:hypothetical protein [Halorubellus sp. JP-L1]NHN43262.1 hypothetical protein [Halorubellus sp. JP-L1]